MLSNSAQGNSIVDRQVDQLDSGRGGFIAIAKLAAQWALGRPGLYGIPAFLPFLGLGEMIYKEPWEPRAMAAGPAAALQANWQASKREEAYRTARLRSLFGSVPNEARWAAVQADCTDEPGWLRYPCYGPAREGVLLQQREWARLGISRGYPTDLAALHVIKSREVVHCVYGGAEFIAAHLIALPTHTGVTPQQAQALSSALSRHSILNAPPGLEAP